MNSPPGQRKRANQNNHPQTKPDIIPPEAKVHSASYDFCSELYHLFIASFQFVLGYLNILEMFGGRSFTAKAIPEQAERVFLVTGGTWLRVHRCKSSILLMQ